MKKTCIEPGSLKNGEVMSLITDHGLLYRLYIIDGESFLYREDELIGMDVQFEFHITCGMPAYFSGFLKKTEERWYPARLMTNGVVRIDVREATMLPDEIDKPSASEHEPDGTETA